MANVRSANQLVWGLAVFSLLLVLLVVLTLYLDLRKQHAHLQAENARLAESQVLLMVPQEQATALTNWLASHPEQTQHLVDHAVKHKAASIQRGTPFSQALSREAEGESPLLVASNPGKSNSATQQNDYHRKSAQMPLDSQFPVVVSETGNGVKVIALPNGGIRVTTRDEDH